MPHVPRLPPADRFFARVDRFECACPNCSRIIRSSRETYNVPKKLEPLYRRRQLAEEYPRRKSVLKLIWNPAVQRLRCPHCTKVYTVGLLLFPVAPGQRRILHAPPDVRMTSAERLELRQLAGGWVFPSARQLEEPVNYVVDPPCICPPKGWSRKCPVHGGEDEPT